MRTTAKLIKMEKLGKNYKLTFRKWNKEQFLILHGNQGKLYSKLKIDNEYRFEYTKGDKYSFVKEKSIKLMKREPQAKDIFIKDLAEKLGICGGNVYERIEKAMEKTMNETNNTNYFNQAKKIIQLLYLKHQELNMKPDQTEEELLQELKTLLFFDMIYPKKDKVEKPPI